MSTSLEWTEDVSPAGKSPILHWNGLMENSLAGSFPYFGRKIKPSPKWTDGCLSSREVSHISMEWTDGKILGWQLPILQRDEDFYVILRGKKTTPTCQDLLLWLSQLD